MSNEFNNRILLFNKLEKEYLNYKNDTYKKSKISDNELKNLSDEYFNYKTSNEIKIDKLKIELNGK